MDLACGIDLGTRRIGLACGGLGAAGPAILDAHVVPVDDLETAADACIAWVLATGARRIVLEHAPEPYIPRPNKNATPEQVRAVIAAGQRVAVAWATCDRLRDMIDTRAVSSGIAVKGYTTGDGRRYRSVPRQTWAHRLCPGTSGGITQARARQAVAEHLDPASMSLLVGDDRLDAAGALLWAILPELPRRTRHRADREPREPRVPMTPEQRRVSHLEAVRRSRGQVPAQVLPVVGARRAHACGRCGRPRKGHVRGLPCPPLPA